MAEDDAPTAEEIAQEAANAGPPPEVVGSNGTGSATEREIAVATWDELLAKPVVRKFCDLVMADGNGDLVERRIWFRALDPDYYQELLDNHPPKREQGKRGLEYDPDEFSLTLIAESMDEPRITRDQVIELKRTKRWTRGEISLLFRTAIDANHGGLEIPFTKTS